MKHDILEGQRLDVQIGEHGYVKLVECSPRLVEEGGTLDNTVAQTARISTSSQGKDDAALIRYLLRHKHATPFEFVDFTFEMSLPIFVARQLVRHRAASINEVSARYTELPDQYWMPDQWRGQSKSNRQGGEESIEYIPYAGFQGSPQDEIGTAEDVAFAEYKRRIEAGVSRELARSCLPVSTYTKWRWKSNLRMVLHFLALRMDPHAQKEIRDYANAVHDLIVPLVPVTLRAWHDFEFEAVTLTRLEVEALRLEIAEKDRKLQEALAVLNKDQIAVPYSPMHVSMRPISDNKREQDEWIAKRVKLGL